MTLDEALDELYAAPLDEFVPTRRRLAKELGGDEGAQLAALRKPSLAAWALNQLARRERRDVDLLLDAGHRLRQAQAGVLGGGDRTAFEQARRTEADALRRLTREAERLLREARGSATAATLGQVNEALRAAAIAEEGRELLARGRFTEPPSAAGFDALAGLDVPAPKPSRRKAAAPKPPRASKELREAEAALREARLRLQAARAQADAAAAEVEAAERRVRRLRA